MKNIFDITRTIRRFDNAKPISKETLASVMQCVTKVASAGNLQRIRYRTVTGDEAASLFGAVSLGAALPKEKKPTADVAPTAYAVLLTAGESVDPNLWIDIGIAAEAIVLSAAAAGIGACIVRNFRADGFAPKTNKEYTPRLVIALGYPAERAEIVSVGEDGVLKYRKDDDGVNRVPKLSLDSLTVD